ncbi:MAG: hypothetical protein HZB61_14145 [Nitrospirae bacterium]|nr:hypothetical protein [Nitrospirota bacterium]
MAGVFLYLSSILFILTLLINSAVSGQELEVPSCVRCHEKAYVKANSSRYQHSVARDKCEICHILPDPEAQRKSSSRFPALEGENILYLDELRDDKKYQVKVSASGPGQKSSESVFVGIAPEEVWKYPGKTLSINQLSGVKIEEVRKGLFVRAVISWDTDNFATSEIEYKAADKYSRRSTFDNTFTKKHKIALEGLKHKYRYTFSVISRDLDGNVLRSEEYVLDTSSGFSNPDITGQEDKVSPVIAYAKVFKSGGKGFYLRVLINKPCELVVSCTEVQKIDDKHGNGLTQARFSMIDACNKCHPPRASHPVGVKAHGPRLRTPEDMPTIEGGVVTCVTCHYPHGGDSPYFARFDYRKDMCIKCHIMGF